MGRPTALTPEVEATILDALRDGSTMACAAELGGIAESTLHDWIARGEGRSGHTSDPRYSEFSMSVKRARAGAEGDAVRVIRNAAQTGTWQAAAWFLERSNPRAWGMRVKEAAREAQVELLDAAKRALDGEHYARLLEAMANRAGAP